MPSTGHRYANSPNTPPRRRLLILRLDAQRAYQSPLVLLWRWHREAARTPHVLRIRFPCNAITTFSAGRNRLAARPLDRNDNGLRTCIRCTAQFPSDALADFHPLRSATSILALPHFNGLKLEGRAGGLIWHRLSPVSGTSSREKDACENGRGEIWYNCSIVWIDKVASK